MIGSTWRSLRRQELEEQRQKQATGKAASATTTTNPTRRQKLVAIWQDPIGRIVLIGVGAFLLVIPLSILREIFPDLWIVWMLLGLGMLLVTAVLIAQSMARLERLQPAHARADELTHLVKTCQEDAILFDGQTYLTDAGRARLEKEQK